MYDLILSISVVWQFPRWSQFCFDDNKHEYNGNRQQAVVNEMQKNSPIKGHVDHVFDQFCLDYTVYAGDHVLCATHIPAVVPRASFTTLPFSPFREK